MTVIHWRRVARGDYEGTASGLVARVQRQGSGWWWILNVRPGPVGLDWHGDERTLREAKKAVERAAGGGRA